MAKYILNENEDHVEKIKQGLAHKKEKYGKEYCPCVTQLVHSEDTICPCKEYRETALCTCKMYVE